MRSCDIALRPAGSFTSVGSDVHMIIIIFQFREILKHFLRPVNHRIRAHGGGSNYNRRKHITVEQRNANE
jgi:hypothetical protein